MVQKETLKHNQLIPQSIIQEINQNTIYTYIEGDKELIKVKQSFYFGFFSIQLPFPDKVRQRIGNVLEQLSG